MIIQKKNPSPVAASDGDEKCKSKHSEDSNEAALAQPFVDRYGHRHGAGIFDHWSPAVIRALGIRRIKPESPEGGAA